MFTTGSFAEEMEARWIIRVKWRHRYGVGFMDRRLHRWANYPQLHGYFVLDHRMAFHERLLA